MVNRREAEPPRQDADPDRDAARDDLLARRVSVHAQLGEKTLELQQLLALKPGSLIVLPGVDPSALSLTIDDVEVARGSAVVTDTDHIALRLEEVEPVRSWISRLDCSRD